MARPKNFTLRTVRTYVVLRNVRPSKTGVTQNSSIIDIDIFLNIKSISTFDLKSSQNLIQ